MSLWIHMLFFKSEIKGSEYQFSLSGKEHVFNIRKQTKMFLNDIRTTFFGLDLVNINNNTFCL